MPNYRAQMANECQITEFKWQCQSESIPNIGIQMTGGVSLGVLPPKDVAISGRLEARTNLATASDLTVLEERHP